jgi:hypothetical protein
VHDFQFGWQVYTMARTMSAEPCRLSRRPVGLSQTGVV